MRIDQSPEFLSLALCMVQIMEADELLSEEFLSVCLDWTYGDEENQ